MNVKVAMDNGYFKGEETVCTACRGTGIEKEYDDCAKCNGTGSLGSGWTCECGEVYTYSSSPHTCLLCGTLTNNYKTSIQCPDCHRFWSKAKV